MHSALPLHPIRQSRFGEQHNFRREGGTYTTRDGRAREITPLFFSFPPHYSLPFFHELQSCGKKGNLKCGAPFACPLLRPARVPYLIHPTVPPQPKLPSCEMRSPIASCSPSSLLSPPRFFGTSRNKHKTASASESKHADSKVTEITPLATGEKLKMMGIAPAVTLNNGKRTSLLASE